MKAAAGNAVFQAASLTKPVVAYAVLKLAQQARLDLDASVASYLPRGYAHSHDPSARATATSAIDLVSPAALQHVTLRMLLNHSSGLPNWAGGPLSFGFAPGTRWRYSGEGYLLLQHVVEAVAGAGLDAVIGQQVFEPLAMHDSAMLWRESLAPRAVPGYGSRGVVPASRYARPLAAASLYTTAHDYATFMSALLTNETLLSLTLTRPVLADTSRALHWGLGWGIESGDGGPYLWQWGNNPGYRAFAMASASTGDGFVALTNSERGLALAEPMAAAVLPGPHRLFGFHMLR